MTRSLLTTVLALASITAPAIHSQNLLEQDFTKWQTRVYDTQRTFIRQTPRVITWGPRQATNRVPGWGACWTRFRVAANGGGSHLLWLRGESGYSTGPNVMRFYVYEVDSSGRRSTKLAEGGWIENTRGNLDQYHTQIPQWRVDLPAGKLVEFEVSAWTSTFTFEDAHLDGAVLTRAELPFLNVFLSSRLSNSHNRNTYVSFQLHNLFSRGSRFFVLVTGSRRFSLPVPLVGFQGSGLWIADPVFVGQTNRQWFDFAVPNVPTLFWQLAEFSIDGTKLNAAIGSRNYVTFDPIR